LRQTDHEKFDHLCKNLRPASYIPISDRKKYVARTTAFEILYREYYGRVFGLCRRLLGSGDPAEDAAQEVFMRAYRNFSKYDASQPFWQWIATIANNHCIDQLRARGRKQALFGDEATELDELPSPDAPVLSELIAREDAGALNEAIAALPDKYRVPLVLAYFHRSSYDDIAGQLNISRNHVGVLLLRAKQYLRDTLATESAGGGQ
jgi:RNA polymerase sigma-70 factor (ECF subfamily)